MRFFSFLDLSLRSFSQQKIFNLYFPFGIIGCVLSTALDWLQTSRFKLTSDLFVGVYLSVLHFFSLENLIKNNSLLLLRFVEFHIYCKLIWWIKKKGMKVKRCEVKRSKKSLHRSLMLFFCSPFMFFCRFSHFNFLSFFAFTFNGSSSQSSSTLVVHLFIHRLELHDAQLVLNFCLQIRGIFVQQIYFFRSFSF